MGNSSQKLRIVILGTAWPFRGGLAAYNERLAKALQDAGHDVSINTFTLQYPNFLFPGKSQFSDAPKPEGLRIDRCLNAINPLSWIRTGLRIRKEAPDLLITKFWLPFMGPALGTSMRVARRRKMKRLTILDNVIPHEKRPGDKLFIRYFVKSSDAFVAMSDSVRNDLRKFSIDKPCTFNPHPLYDHFGAREERKDAIAKLGLDSDKKYMLFFGFIRDYKGLDILLEAFADEWFLKNNIRLIVAGEFYTDEQPYMQLIDSLELADQVVLRTDFIPDDQVANYFNAADIIVQPYKTATQSGVTQIAYHFEKPMLVTDVGGLAEIVPHGKAGYVVKPDAQSVRDALKDFYQSDRFDAMVEGTREEKQKYSWERMIETILSTAFSKRGVD